MIVSKWWVELRVIGAYGQGRRGRDEVRVMIQTILVWRWWKVVKHSK